jgi:site-specific DNA-methyltransferase (adenine-specific)
LIAKVKPDSRSCLRCGTRNPPDTHFCTRCGEKLRGIKVTNKAEKKKMRVSASEPQRVEAVGSQTATRFEVNTIYCGDSLEIMRQIPDEYIDLIITSPPYNFGLDEYDNHIDTKSWDEYFDTLYLVWRESHRVLKQGGRICVVVQPLFSDYIPTHHIISQQLRDLGFLFKAEIMWEKHNWNCKYTAWGSWKSPSMPYLKYTWEFIEVFCKGSQKKGGRTENIDITGDEFKKWVYSKWEVAPESRMKEFEHPSMFPEEIPYRLIRLFSYIGDLVLDPFNGVGTTTLVAHKLQRNYIGIDISEKYCRKAEKRIAEFERQPRLL